MDDGKREKKSLLRGDLLGMLRPITRRSVAAFYRELAILLSAGMPLIRALDILARRVSNLRLRKVIAEVSTEVEGGKPLWAALKSFPRHFSRFAVNMVRAGEAGGRLDHALGRMAGFREREMVLRHRANNALVYPLVVFGLMLLVVLLVLAWVVPTFSQMYLDPLRDKTGVALPPFTEMLKWASERWFSALIILICVVVIYQLVGLTKPGRPVLDRIKFHLPVFGSFIQRIVVVRFARCLCTLLHSGVPLVQSLEVVQETVDNEAAARAIDSMRQSVADGSGIAGPLSESGLFPPIVADMVGVGEEAGKLDEVLQRIAHIHENEVDTSVARLTSFIDPALTVIMGLAVGAIALGLLLPYVQMLKALEGPLGTPFVP